MGSASTGQHRDELCIQGKFLHGEQAVESTLAPLQGGFLPHAAWAPLHIPRNPPCSRTPFLSFLP